MLARELNVDGAFEFDPVVHSDERGSFAEVFTEQSFRSHVYRDMRMAQLNVSTSRKGVVRGVHFSPLQAKYVTCASGYVVDYLVDVRPGSKTFREVDVVHLCDRSRRAVFVPPGVGHAFEVVSDTAVVVYACSYPYDPTIEYGVSPLDPDLGIRLSTREPILSAKDAQAPTLAQFLRERGD